jgi:hypothetical protein
VEFVCLLHQDSEPRPLVALQPLGLLYALLFFVELPTVAVRCLHVLRDARDPTLMGDEE